MNSLALPQPTFPIEVRPATHDDVPFMDRLQKLHGKSVGYFPTGQFNGYVDLGAVLIAHRAGEPSAAVGYVISRDRYLKRDELGVVYQLNVDPSAQRSFVGAALLGAAFERSAYGCKLYCCWCAKDLAANKFWEAMGFVPLAFRAGSDKKKRVHIFWQKRINQGDAVTPWWYPYQTTGGAIRADRLVFPIPAGVHWSDVEATAVPAVGGGDALALPPVRKVKKSQVPKAAVDPHEGKIRIFVGGKFKWIKRPTNLGSRGVQFGPPPVVVPVAPPAAAVVVRERRERPKVKPEFVGLVRELRDRYLERVNGGFAEVGALDAKYDAVRPLPAPTPLPALPMAA